MCVCVDPVLFVSLLSYSLTFISLINCLLSSREISPASGELWSKRGKQERPVELSFCSQGGTLCLRGGTLKV